MDEPGSVLFLAVIRVALSGAVAFGLYRLITVKGKPLTAIDYGRKWTAWMVCISTMTTLPKFFRHLDIDSFLRWAVGAISFGILAFIAGLIYGKVTGPKKEELPKMKDNQTGVDHVRSANMPRVSVNDVPSSTTHERVKVDSKPIIIQAQSTALTTARNPIPDTESNQDDFYSQAWDEMNDQDKTPNKAMWAKAFSMTQGDETKTQAKYIELRVAQLQQEQAVHLQKINSEQEQAHRVEEIARAQAEEKAKAEAEKITPEKMAKDELQALTRKIHKIGGITDSRNLIEKLGGSCKYTDKWFSYGIEVKLWDETYKFSEIRDFILWVQRDIVPRVLDKCQKIEEKTT